jgi:3-deoxy-D-manno-octulosonic-acid transferase
VIFAWFIVLLSILSYHFFVSTKQRGDRLLELFGTIYRWAAMGLEGSLSHFIVRNARQDPVFWQGRLGNYAFSAARDKSPRIWFHAASVGEVTGAIPVLNALRKHLPQAQVFLSVSTSQGYHFARTEFAEKVQVLPSPIDFPMVLRRAFQSLQPDLYVGLESEFWPNLLNLLQHHQVPLLLLNGHMSERSARWYKYLKPMFKSIFRGFSCFAMHSEEDRKNIVELGAPEERTVVLGSSKYDALFMRRDPLSTHRWRTLLELSEEDPILIGGSLRRSECIHLLEVFENLAQKNTRLKGIFVPRHLKQIPRMILWLERRGLPFQLLSTIENGSEKRETDVILVDRMGVLFELYALGDLIFCGGTLEPVGAHNIMEPAAWERAVFYGPHLQNVPVEHNILQSFKASFLVSDPGDLLQQWQYWLDHRSELRECGRNGLRALRELGGVADQQVQLVLAVLSSRLSANPLDVAAAGWPSKH